MMSSSFRDKLLSFTHVQLENRLSNEVCGISWVNTSTNFYFVDVAIFRKKGKALGLMLTIFNQRMC